VDDHGAVDRQLSPARGWLRGGWLRDGWLRGGRLLGGRLLGGFWRRLRWRLGGVGLVQLTQYPRADRLAVPSGPDLQVLFGLDFGPLRLGTAFPGVACAALAEDHHERGGRMPVRGTCLRLGQHVPGIVLPPRNLLEGRAWP